MPSANKTTNYGLNQWLENEYPKRQDFVDDNALIDEILKANADAVTATQETTDGIIANFIRSPGYGVTTGAANTYILALDPTPVSYSSGMGVVIKLHDTNTGASTLNVNGLGAVPIKKADGSAVKSGDLPSGSVFSLRYNGINFILQGERGLDTTDATAVAGNILSGYTAYVNDAKITGTIPVRSAQTYTPGTSNQTITSGQYLSGNQTISGDADLVSANIKAGINIFGVSGSPAVVNTSDATAAAASILSGNTGYVNGIKVTGSMTDRTTGDYAADAISVSSATLKLSVPANAYYGGTANITCTDASFTASNIRYGTSVFGITGNVVPATTTTYSTPGTYTFTVPAGVTHLNILINGAGGGGAGGQGGTGVGGSINPCDGVTYIPGSTFPGSYGSNGNNGGVTSLGALVTLSGSSGGLNSGGTNSGAAGGAGGTGSGGNGIKGGDAAPRTSTYGTYAVSGGTQYTVTIGAAGAGGSGGAGGIASGYPIMTNGNAGSTGANGVNGSMTILAY